MFGIRCYVAAQCFMTMCVSALALTSLDSVARIGRMSFQELFSVDDMEHAAGLAQSSLQQILLNHHYTGIVDIILTQVGYANIWPLFGSANQLLSALVLITLCVFLKVTGRENQHPVPAAHHHAVCNLYRTGTANYRTGQSIQRRNCSIHGGRTSADPCNPAHHPWC